MTLARVLLPAFLLLAVPHASANAQAVEAPAAEHSASHASAEEAKVDIITPHITDGHHLELPYWKPPFYKEIHLPEWEPVRVGPLLLDFSPTKHVIFLLLAATLCILVLVGTARSHQRASRQIGRPRGFAAASSTPGGRITHDAVIDAPEGSCPTSSAG